MALLIHHHILVLYGSRSRTYTQPSVRLPTAKLFPLQTYPPLQFNAPAVSATFDCDPEDPSLASILPGLCQHTLARNLASWPEPIAAKGHH